MLLAAVLATGCGHIGFDTIGAPGGGGTDAPGGGDSGGPPTGAVAYVAPAGAHFRVMGGTQTFALQAVQAGDAIVMFVACSGAQIPSTATVTASGWTFTALGPVTGSSSSQLWMQTLGAIAPDTASAQVTVTLVGSNCNRGTSALADEFANVDPVMPFDAHAETTGSGNVSGTITTAHAGDAVWGACYTGSMLTAVGAGFTKGADDANGDWSEYKLASDPLGTVETVTFTNGAQPWALSMATIKPR